MNVLFIGYWSVMEGLSESTIKPHLEILSTFKKVDEIFFATIERDGEPFEYTWNIDKVSHVPFLTAHSWGIAQKLNDFTKFPKLLIKLCREKNIQKIICRSSMAGAIGYMIWRKTKIPYFVESFEPHASYMIESGIWKKNGIKVAVQKFFERRQKQTASALFPVSDCYTEKLQEQNQYNIPIKTLPCAVNYDKFKFNTKTRENIRSNLNLSPNQVVGIYVGKFGGIYYEKEAFRFFSGCFKYIPNFFLIILTAQDRFGILNKLKTHKITPDSVWVDKVEHEEVPEYLSAADIAFNFHIKTKSAYALSPIKNGEYWANGLPIVISPGIGDDSSIIRHNGGGTIVNFNVDNGNTIFNDIENLVQENNLHRSDNISTRLALKHRNFSQAREVYTDFMKSSVF